MKKVLIFIVFALAGTGVFSQVVGDKTGGNWFEVMVGRHEFRWGWQSVVNMVFKDGKLGIAELNPEASLQINNHSALGSTVKNYILGYMLRGNVQGAYLENRVFFLRDAAGTGWEKARLHDAISVGGGANVPGVSTLTWWERNGNSDIQAWGHRDKTYMVIKSGNVGIGTLTPTQKLDVNGTIRANKVNVDGNLNTQNVNAAGLITAKEIKVQTNVVWSDFVFDKSYKLPSLAEVEAHINEHQHLPEIPSAAEVGENGIDLAEMNAKLLQKVEELTLYVIQQNKDISALKEEIDVLKSK